jgi:hypothetical protein
VNGGNLIEAVDRNKRPIKVCQCPSGFRGEHCEENINDCVGIMCSSRGICQDAINNYTCFCFDGFYGDHCQETETEAMLLQVVSKSFAVVAILLIASIGLLVVASDIHTYVTRRKPRKQAQLQKSKTNLRASSELIEHSVLLLGSSETSIELKSFSRSETKRRKKFLQLHATTSYSQLSQSQSANSIPAHFTPINQS